MLIDNDVVRLHHYNIEFCKETRGGYSRDAELKNVAQVKGKEQELSLDTSMHKYKNSK